MENFIGNANGKICDGQRRYFYHYGCCSRHHTRHQGTRAKDGYILEDTPQTVKVKSNEVITVEFRNQPKGGVLVKKVGRCNE